MKKIGIVYELRQREIDNCLLLKEELERRGYEVVIINKYLEYFLRKKCDLLLVPNCYGTDDLDNWRYRFNANGIPVVCFPIEQIRTLNTENALKNYSEGDARTIPTLCWGKRLQQIYKAVGVAERNIFVTGALQQDFLLPGFEKFWLNKDELGREYGIPTDKKWLLFISSFSFANNAYLLEELHTEEAKKAYAQHTAERKTVLAWFEEYLRANPDVLIVYRPHPMEWFSEDAKQVQAKNPDRFFIVSERNMKQWVRCSDVVATWYSTSIGECYDGKKSWLILRPTPIEPGNDMRMYLGSDQCRDYDSFAERADHALKEGQLLTPLTYDAINEYYSTAGVPNFIRVADVLEQIDRERGSYSVSEPGFRRRQMRFYRSNRIVLKNMIKRIYQFLYASLGLTITDPRMRKKYAVEKWEEEARMRKAWAIEERGKAAVLKEIVAGYGEERETNCNEG